MPQLNTSSPVTSFLNSSTTGEMRVAANVLVSSDLLTPQANIHSGLTFVNSVPAKVFGGVIPDNALNGDTTATEIYWGDMVTNIGSAAFNNCSGLTGELLIPDSVTIIGDNAFNDCDFTGPLTIGSSVTYIGDYAFNACYVLTGSLVIPDSVTSIGSGAFTYCGFTGSLTIGSGVTNIGDYAFYNCTSFTGLVIDNGVTGITIGNNAFQNCSGLIDDLIIPDSVTSIGSTCFYGCSNLTTVYVNVDAAVIDSTAFVVSGVTIIYYEATKTGWTDPWNGITTAEWTSFPDPMP